MRDRVRVDSMRLWKLPYAANDYHFPSKQLAGHFKVEGWKQKQSSTKWEKFIAYEFGVDELAVLKRLNELYEVVTDEQ